jgi:hypothetical protein
VQQVLLGERLVDRAGRDQPHVQQRDAVEVFRHRLQRVVQLADAKAGVQRVEAAQHLEHVGFTEEASSLAERYISEGVITTSMRLDAQHIEIATVERVDVLVSWNFEHIVNLQRIRGYNSVNLRAGYPLLEIRSPEEVVPYATEAED